MPKFAERVLTLHSADFPILEIINAVEARALEIARLIGADALKDLRQTKEIFCKATKFPLPAESPETAMIEAETTEESLPEINTEGIPEEAVPTIRSLTVKQVKGVMRLILAAEEREKMRGRALNAEEINLALEGRLQTDSLTRLYNKEGLAVQGERLFEYCKSHEIPLICLYLDIDYFKNVNETHGHPVGDVVLKQFAELVGREFRGYDVIFKDNSSSPKDTASSPTQSPQQQPPVMGRDGGEEFAIFMPYTDIEGAVAGAERLRKRVQNHSFGITNQSDGSTTNLSLTCSIGIVEVDFGTDHSAAEIKKLADDTMLMGKHQYRNVVTVMRRIGGNGTNITYPSLKDPERITPKRPAHSH